MCIPNLMSYVAEDLRKCSSPTMCCMSCVTCHVSCFMCHMSHVYFNVYIFYKVMELGGGGSIINRAYPSSLQLINHTKINTKYKHN